MRQSRNAVSMIAPSVSCAPVSRAAVSATRRSESSRAATFARSPRSTTTSVSRRPRRRAPATAVSAGRPSSATRSRPQDERLRLGVEPWRLRRPGCAAAPGGAHGRRVDRVLRGPRQRVVGDLLHPGAAKYGAARKRPELCQGRCGVVLRGVVATGLGGNDVVPRRRRRGAAARSARWRSRGAERRVTLQVSKERPGAAPSWCRGRGSGGRSSSDSWRRACWRTRSGTAWR